MDIEGYDYKALHFYLPWILIEKLYLQTVDIPGLGFNTSEYYPYVSFKINTDMIGDHRN